MRVLWFFAYLWIAVFAHAAKPVPFDRRCEIALADEALEESPEILEWIRAQITPVDLFGALSEIEHSNRNAENLNYYGVDVVKEYLRREKNSDSHAKWLDYLGITIEGRDTDSPRFHFPAPGVVIARANAYTAKLVQKGILKSSEAVYLGVAYVRKSALQGVSEQYEIEDLAFVRPGLDKKLNRSVYEPLKALPQFKHTTWQEILASGILPSTLGVSNFMHHDLAHLTDLLANPRLMAATRNYYRWASKQPMAWRKKVTLSNSSAMITGSSISPMTLAHSERLVVATEVLNLVSERGKLLVREKLDDFFGSLKPPKDWQEHLATNLAGLSLNALVERAAELNDLAQKTVERHGGAMRDPYNLGREAFSEDLYSPWKKTIYSGAEFKNEPQPKKTPTLAQMRESLLGMIETARWIAMRMTHPKLMPLTNAAILERGETELRQLIAQIETGLAYSVLLDMKPEDFFNELTSYYAREDSKTGDYVSRFARPDGMLWQSFLSPEAQGTAVQTPMSFLLELSEKNEAIVFHDGFRTLYVKKPSRLSRTDLDAYQYGFLVSGGEVHQLNSKHGRFKSTQDLVGSDKASLLYVLDLLKIDYSGVRRWK